MNWVWAALARALRMTVGFTLGLAGTFAVAGCVIYAVSASSSVIARVNPPLSTSGADISGAGGRAVSLVGADSRIDQSCRDVCDDLRVAGELRFARARVVDSRGNCVLCRRAALWRPGVKAWTIAGVPTLALTDGAGR